MSSFAVVQNAASSEMTESSAQVEINGVTYDWMTCTAIEQSVGITPSKARIHIGGGNYDVTGPITLNAVKWPFMAGSRVKIYMDNSTPMFLGALRKRVDNGGSDDIQWEAWDDRWLLMQIPVRGCVIYDPYPANTPKFIPRMECRVNPGGYWNCTGAKIKGVIYPVFTPVAELGQTYEAPNAVFKDVLEEGKLTAWTPRRFLMYLNLLANLKAGDLPGIESDSWRSLATSKRLQWPASNMQIVGKDLAQNVDPLDYKMTDRKFQGMRMLGALEDTLKIAGTHGLTLSYAPDSSNSLVSNVAFYAERANAGRPKGLLSIPMVRGGSATDINTAFDFELEDDASMIAESVLDEGAPVRVESSFAYDTLLSATTLIPAWSAAEEKAFIDCINGDPNEPGTVIHAWYPATQNGVPSGQNGTVVAGDRLYADGLQGRPLALKLSDEAVSLARKCFPHVFRAYCIDSNAAFNAGILKGYLNQYAASPIVLGIPRPILEKQLQYYIESPSGSGVDVTNRLKEYFDIRIEVSTNDVSANTATGFHDVADNSGLRIKSDGYIYFDGLTENINSTNDCVYSGDLKTNPTAVKRRFIRINCAVPLDVRVRGYVERKKGESQLDPALFADLGGPFQQYLDTIDSFIEHHQVTSRPSPSVKYFGGTDGATAAATDANGAVSRILPPGSEQPHALYAAQRKLASMQNPSRRSSWKLIGIRPEFYAGLWVDCVRPVNGPAGDTDYDINSPIRTVVYDFMNQITIVGGLISQLSTNTPNKNTKAGIPAATGPKGGGQAAEDKSPPSTAWRGDPYKNPALKNGPQEE